MGIFEEEQKILAELNQLANEDEVETKDSEELLEEIQNDTATTAEHEEEREEQGEEAPEETEEDAGEEQEESEEHDDPEEEIEEELVTGAKLRHKMKEIKAAKEESDRKAQEMAERLARLEGRAEATAAPAAQEVQEDIPDAELEPELHAIYNLTKKLEKLETSNEKLATSNSRAESERSWDRYQTNYAKTNPDYEDAKAFLLDSEAKKIRTSYPSATDAQIAQHLREQELMTAGNAAQSGQDPIQQIEFLAYQAGFRAEANQEKPGVKKKANIKNIKRNARKSASLIGGSAAGKSGDNRSADQLAQMGIDEIHKFGVKNFENAIKKLEARS